MAVWLRYNLEWTTVARNSLVSCQRGSEDDHQFAKAKELKSHKKAHVDSEPGNYFTPRKPSTLLSIANCGQLPYLWSVGRHLIPALINP